MSNNLRTLITDAYENGKYTYSTFRKLPAIASTAGYWVDLSMAPGTPKPNYYVGDERVATVPTAWYKQGLWHGGAVLPQKKYLHKISLLGAGAAANPAPYILCDYLMYYSLIDMDSTDVQILDNSLTSLPRYTTGEGVQAFLVATQPYIGGGRFQITYTNQSGVSGRVSKITTTNTSTYIGTIVNSNTAGLTNFGAFIELQAGDRGIRSVQSVNFFAANGGLASLVLVRPIATIMIREATAFAEFDFIKDKPSIPRIYDDAYLNFLTMPNGTIAAVPIMGEITTIWSS